MPPMTTSDKLFLHELKDTYYAEKTLVNVLPTLADEATDPHLVEAFSHHREETRTHVANLERVFARSARPPRGGGAGESRGSRKSTTPSCASRSPARTFATCS